MRRIKAKFGDSVGGGVWRLVSANHLAAQWQPDLRILVIACSDEERSCVEQIKAAGLLNVDWIESSGVHAGDVVVRLINRDEVAVLHRPSDMHHSLQLTNRCNSYCLMCSQPPTQVDDEWMVQEALDVVLHMADSPVVIGLSGGEPLLLGTKLRDVLDRIGDYHPGTRVEVLTNGRLLAREELSRSILCGLRTSTTWLVPLYGHADFLHDFVVQTPGAYEQTIEGLLNLQVYRQSIQLRIVLIRPVLENLPELCAFIGRSLPFVKEVALMACEPIGFALANRDLCEVDLVDWHETLRRSARHLRRYAIPFLFMNTPLCALPIDLHQYAHRSISDWKAVYTPECEACDVKSDCSGLFAWHERGWKPSKKVHFIKEHAV